jgi:hypothetical protein
LRGEKEVAELTFSVRRTAAAVPLAFLCVLAFVVLGAAPASAATEGKRTTNTTVIHFPVAVLDNLCNGDAVAVNGDLTITQTTVQHRDGSFTIWSNSSAPNLTGQRLTPPPIDYNAADVEQSRSRNAPPPSPAYSFSDVHWTKLVPHGPAPTMYLVVVTRETLFENGKMVTMLDRAYLACTQPCRQSTQ